MNALFRNSDVEIVAPASKRPTAGPAPRSRLWRFLQDCSPRAAKTVPVQARTRRRRLQRCTRAVLIWGLLWYAMLHLIPLLLLGRSKEYPWHAIWEAMEARKLPQLRQLVAEDPNRPLLLALGSSRMCWDLRALSLDGMPDSDGRPMRVYNFGIPATGPIFELLYLRDLLAEGIRPSFVLIEINPTLLCEHRRDALNEENMMFIECTDARQVLKWLPYFEHPAKSVYAWLSARLAPWYIFRRQVKLEVNTLTKHQPVPTYGAIDARGWHLSLLRLWPASERQYRVESWRLGYYPALSRFRLGKKPIQATYEILDLCRAEKISAALVVMPESSQFRSWYSEEGESAIRGLLDELSRTYGVTVIDARFWLADDDFEDGQHALLHGAEVFTDRLAAELPRLIAQSKAAKSD